MANQNKILKFIIFLLIFFLIFAAFLFFIIPKIKEYKNKKAEYEQYIQQNQTLLKEQELLHKKIEELKSKKKQIISSFENEFNEIEFINFAKEFFDEVELIKNEQMSNEYGFDVYSFEAISKMKTPIKFYQFIEKLPQYHNVVKINFPIILEAEDDILSISFQLNIYKLK